MFIQTEATPNPATLKFLPGKVVLPEGTYDFRSKIGCRSALRSLKSCSKFRVSRLCFFGHDFVTVTKDETDWQHMKPAILGVIMEQFMSGQPVMAAGEVEDIEEGEFFDEGDAETVTTIKELLETRVRPAVAQDGGDITFKGFKEGVVYLSMRGACAGCPSSTATLAARHPEPSAPLRAGS